MASALLLERSGRWRPVAVAMLLALVAAPALPLAEAAFGAPSGALGPAFWRSLATSRQVAVAGSTLALLLGLPLGVGMAVAAFRGKLLLLVLLGLPLVVPSFLWAVGWSMLAGRFGAMRAAVGGFGGCVVVAATATTALVSFASYAATLELSRSQRDAAVLAGGERALVGRAARHALLPGVLAAALGAALTLSDPGPGQILGVHTVAAEILTSFAARYDVALAGRQCLALTVLVSFVALPVAWFSGPRIADGMLARQLGSARPMPGGWLGPAVAAGGHAVIALAVLPPVAGLLLPLLDGSPIVLGDALGGREGARATNHLPLGVFAAARAALPTATSSILYAVGAGSFATIFAVLVALAVGRSRPLRIAVLGACILLFSWPSFASALAVAEIGSRMPHGLDFLFRSRLTVCLVLAGHLAPVATLLLLRALGAVSPSWTHAAEVHGVRLGRYLRSVVWPALLPSALLALALVALLASADAGTVLMLHPPGETSLALTIVTVMANAPEAYVAALCLVYLISTIALLLAALGFLRGGRAA